MDWCLWKEDKWENANEKDVILYEERVDAKEEKDISIVKKRERRCIQVHKWKIEKEIYQTLKVASNSISIFIENLSLISNIVENIGRQNLLLEYNILMENSQ